MASNLQVTTGTLIPKGTLAPPRVTSPAQLRRGKVPFGQTLARDIEGLAAHVGTLYSILSTKGVDVSQILVNGQSVTDTLTEFVGDTGAGGASGLVPAPKPGDAAAGKFLGASGRFERPASTAAVVDTHANRSSHPAKSGTFYFETDRRVLYIGVASAWVYMAGGGIGTLSSRPGDLVASDAGYQWFDSAGKVLSFWTGTSWADVMSPATWG